MTGCSSASGSSTTGGAERVLDRLAGLFPDADMLCLWNDAPGALPRPRGARDLARPHAAAPPQGARAAADAGHLARPAARLRLGARQLARLRPPRQRRFARRAEVRLRAHACPIPVGARARRARRQPRRPAGRSPAAARSTAAPRRRPRHRGEQPIRRRPRGARLGSRGHRDPSPGRCRVDPSRRVARGSSRMPTGACWTRCRPTSCSGCRASSPTSAWTSSCRRGELLGLPVVIAGHGPLEAQLRAMARMRACRCISTSSRATR